MPIVKLVCQGCGANLDAPDTSRIVECGYCHTRNHIKPTVYQEAPRPIPPQPIQPQPMPQQVVQYQLQANQQLKQTQQASKAGGVIALFIVLGALLPLVIGGVVAWTSLRGVTITGEPQRGQGGGRALVVEGGGDQALVVEARRYIWRSGRPLFADVSGDQVDDVVGLIMPFGNSNLSLIAVDGATWQGLWEVSIGDVSTMSGQQQVYFLPAQKLVLVSLGASLHAYDQATGQQRWIANLPDRPDVVALADESSLFTHNIDDSLSTVTLADGKVGVHAGKVDAKQHVRVRNDAGYDLIPSNSKLDLGREPFEDLSLEVAFCPPELVEFQTKPVWGPDEVPCTYARGLAWAARKKGTQVPFLVGYDPKSKKELWRQQLGTAGSLETVDGGFGQPRAEFAGDDAIVSFVPSGQDNARIRRISLLDGASRWEVTLERTSTENVDGMAVGRDRVLVNYGGRVEVLNLADGSVIERLGGW